MGKYTGPKDKLSRREGFDLFGGGAKITRLTVPPGVHGPRGVRNTSRYGKQLREKQKVKRIYGILEKQFRKYIEIALKSRGNTGEKLLTLLERRLDNVVYRLGFAPSRPAARQFVSHGHILVNGKRVNIPSYQVRPGESIGLTNDAMKIPDVSKLLLEKDLKVPEWLEKKAAFGKVKRVPNRGDIVDPISEQDIVEFYSR